MVGSSPLSCLCWEGIIFCLHDQNWSVSFRKGGRNFLVLFRRFLSDHFFPFLWYFKLSIYIISCLQFSDLREGGLGLWGFFPVKGSLTIPDNPAFIPFLLHCCFHPPPLWKSSAAECETLLKFSEPQDNIRENSIDLFSNTFTQNTNAQPPA